MDSGKNGMGIVIVAIVAIGALVLMPGIASAAIRVVNQTSTPCITGDSYHTTIQAAIGAASGGDEIIVCNGTYTENVDVNKRVTIRSLYGAAVTKVQANNNTFDHVFHVTADYVNITGFTVQNATNSAGIMLGVISGSGVDNCTISENTVSNNFQGIALFKSSDNNITGNTVSNNYNGIDLSISNYNNITNNSASNNDYGIFLYSASNNNITNNSASNNDYGISMQSSSNYNTLTDNNASNNSYDGIFLQSSNNNIVTNNTASNNTQIGIYLDSSNYNSVTNNTVSNNIVTFDSSGIYLLGSSYNDLTGNIVSNNYYGIRLYSSSNYNNLTGNTVSYNDYGIDMYSSNNNIYNNYFNNTDDNAYDDGTNIWNISKTPGINIIGGPYLGGNYWSDYAGTDTDDDGLGNTPYNISGGSNQDNLPLVRVLSCTCGDLCVNEMGWWRHNNTFNANLSTPIQAAVDNATENETICVQNGSYTENVDVDVDNLTIKSKYGAAYTTVQAASASDYVFHVTANYVNVSGFTVRDATNYAGICLDSVEHCNISYNCVMYNYNGILLQDGSKYNDIIWNTANSNGANGIDLALSNYNNIIWNTANSNGANGIDLANSWCTNITGNTASNNYYDGIYLYSSSYNTLTGNNASSNSNDGLILYYLSHDNNLTANTASNNYYYGIYLYSSSYNNITGNTANSNSEIGIYLESSNNNNLNGNTANASSDEYIAFGIYLRDSDYNNLTGNTANSNNINGISLFDSEYNNLTGNTANSNGYAGITVDSSQYNNLTGNTVNANGVSGIILFGSYNNMLLDNFVEGHKSLDGSFDVLLLAGASWTYQGELGFRNYETLELPLTHGAGALTLRLTQHGHDSAYVDYVALKKGDRLYEPATAVNLDRGADSSYKLVAPDYDVCDAWESTLELSWDSVPADTTLVMRAVEEDLGPGHGSPLYYPLLREGRTLSYTLVNDGGITVDGVLDESKAPSFSVFWRPDSPHPEGYTYGWLHADDQYLYAAVEVTADNTADEEDWGALFIQVDDALREFRIAPAETAWGQIGFQYTSSVPYEHRIYEFAIPLNVLNARIGDELRYGFGAYGTAAVQYAGIVLEYSDNNNLTYNTVTDNEIGIYLNNASWNNISCNWVHHNIQYGFYLIERSIGNMIENNNIMFNGVELEDDIWHYNFYNGQSDNVTAMWNYWGMDGTQIEALINASIYDHYDYLDLGIVDFSGYSDSPAGCAPIPEAATILLFSVGLLALVGYTGVQRRRSRK